MLGAGGARGAALAGVLRRLRSEGIAVGSILGCSVGAIVAGLYAGAGMEPEEMIAWSRRLGPSSLFAFALSRWRLPWVSRRARRRCEPLWDGFDRLERATFTTLHHGLRRLGILAYDLRRRVEVVIQGAPGRDPQVPLAAAVAASAAIPGLFPPLRIGSGAARRWLADAGWSTAVPIEQAFAPGFGARRVLAVDLGLRTCLRQARRSYWADLRESCGDRLIVLRPELRRFPTMMPRPRDADALAAAGEASLTDEAIALLRLWQSAPDGAAAAGPFLDHPGTGC